MKESMLNIIQNRAKALQKESQYPNARWSVPEFNDNGERRCLMCEQDYPCICADRDDMRYTAHCMNCNWSLSRDGTIGHYIAPSAEEALKLWNLLNDRETLYDAVVQIEMYKRGLIS